MYKRIEINKVIPPQLDIRSESHEEGLADLTQSIKEYGLIEPIVVREVDGKFEIIAGHRRYMAYQRLGDTTIPAVIMQADDDLTMMLKVHENLHRTNLSPLENANLVAYLHYEKGWDIKKIAKKIKHSEKWVLMRIDLFHMPDDFKEAVNAGQISLSTALKLMEIEDIAYRNDLFARGRFSGLTVGQAQIWVDEWRRYRGPEIDEERRDLIEAGEVKPITPYVQCHICSTDVRSGTHGLLIVCPACHIDIVRHKQHLKDEQMQKEGQS